MKKCRWLIIAAFSLFLIACRPSVYEVHVNSVPYTIDSKNQTITVGDDIYTYRISGDSSEYKIRITFPDGESYVHTNVPQLTWTDGNEDLSYQRKHVGEKLAEYLEYEVPKAKKPVGKVLGRVFLGVAMAAGGVFFVRKPEVVWKMDHWVCVKNGEPTEYALFRYRFGGWALIVAGIGSVLVFFLV